MITVLYPNGCGCNLMLRLNYEVYVANDDCIVDYLSCKHCVTLNFALFAILFCKKMINLAKLYTLWHHFASACQTWWESVHSRCRNSCLMISKMAAATVLKFNPITLQSSRDQTQCVTLYPCTQSEPNPPTFMMLWLFLPNQRHPPCWNVMRWPITTIVEYLTVSQECENSFRIFVFEGFGLMFSIRVVGRRARG